MTATRRSAAGTLPLIFLCSGIAGLGYQVTWLRMFAVGIGHELPSMLAVVSAFFGGLALGSLVLDRRLAASRRPGAWYVALELLIAAWAPITVFALPRINAEIAAWIGLDPGPLRHWGLAFALPFLALLPATFAMGGTFPAMERLAARLSGDGRTVARLYAVNTLGALVGTLALTFWLLPALGSSASLLVLAAINVACAAAVHFGPARGEAERPRASFAFPDAPSDRRLGIAVATTGLAGIGFQVACVRVMGQALENTVYSFAAGLSLYLLGTAVGAALYQRLASAATFEPNFRRLAAACALAVGVTPFALANSTLVYESLRDGLGGGFAGSVGAELLLAALVFLPATALMGALFSHLVQAARRAEGGVGRAMATNMLGAALAPPIFGVLILPAFGAKIALLLAAASYVLLLASRATAERCGLGLAALVGVAYLAPSLVLVQAPHGGRIVAYREGVLAAVSVVQGADGARAIKVNNRFSMGGTTYGFAEWRQAHLPLLLHPDPRKALFLGVGAGSTARAATVHPGLDVQAVELVPEVVELLPLLDTAPPGEFIQSKVHYRLADARRFVQATDERYDVIVADLYQPARDGSGALYTREHFAAIDACLEEGGLFCQWLPLYQMDMETVRLIVRTFFDVFPDGAGLIGHYNLSSPILGLVSGVANNEYAAGWFDKRTEVGQLRAALATSALADDLDLFGCLLGDRAALLELAGPGPLNTDDHPRVTFRAPQFTYAKGQTSYGRALEILAQLAGKAGRSVSGPEFAARVNRHAAARDLFLEHSRQRMEGSDAAAVESLIQSVRADPEFETSVVFGLRLAEEPGLAQGLAERLLDGLAEARPGDARIRQARLRRR